MFSEGHSTETFSITNSVTNIDIYFLETFGI